MRAVQMFVDNKQVNLAVDTAILTSAVCQLPLQQLHNVITLIGAMSI